MKNNFFKLLKPIIPILLAVLLTPRAFLSEMYQFDYDTTYTVNEDLSTSVNQQINLTNLTDDSFAASYSINLKNMDVSNFTAYDEYGAMETTQRQIEDERSLNVIFNRIGIGVDTKKYFEVNYNTSSIASKTGRVLNIYIPKASASEISNTYNVAVKVPTKYGKNIFSSPKPVAKEESGDYYTYTFDKDAIDGSGITLAFGEYQHVSFNLKYEIKNTSKLPKLYEISLPTDKDKLPKSKQ